MIFRLGETFEQKRVRLGKWRPMFALVPRQVGIRDGKVVWAWLQWIEVMAVPYPFYGEQEWLRRYRLPEQKSS